MLLTFDQESYEKRRRLDLVKFGVDSATYPFVLRGLIYVVDNFDLYLGMRKIKVHSELYEQSAVVEIDLDEIVVNSDNTYYEIGRKIGEQFNSFAIEPEDHIILGDS